MNNAPLGKPGPNEFLERKIYRHRRLIDAVKLLPILGACLFLVPAMILGGEGEPASTATRLVYFFFIWVVLILISATIARALSRSDDQG